MAKFNGKRLKLLREEKNLSQQEMAKLLGVSRPTVTKYEIGERHPEPKAMEKMLDYFNVSLDYLFGRSGERNAEKKLLEASDMNVIDIIRKKQMFDGEDNIVIPALKEIQDSLHRLPAEYREDALRCCSGALNAMNYLLLVPEEDLPGELKIELLKVAIDTLRRITQLCRQLTPYEEMHRKQPSTTDIIKTHTQAKNELAVQLDRILELFLKLYKTK